VHPKVIEARFGTLVTCLENNNAHTGECIFIVGPTRAMRLLPNLFPKGQEFVTWADKRLQQMIEDKLKENPIDFAYFELNNLNFTRFEFQTVTVYCNSG
jgi:hypothetical protein